MNVRRLALHAGVAVVALAAGFFAHLSLRSASPDAAASAEMFALTLPDPQGRPEPMTQWRDKVLVVNFWATWCEPCREEVPALIRTQQKYAPNGVEIVGIAVDSAAKVRDFAKEYGISYPLLVGGLETIEVSRKLGNKIGGLPYTVIVDRGGRVAHTRLGGISEADLDRVLRPLLGLAPG